MVKWIVEGRRWFDKVNGNTYHNVRIINARTNEEVYESGQTYGYGDGWKQTAMDWLIKNGKWKIEDRFNHELVRKNFHFNVSDVDRKKDMVNLVS